MCEQAYRSNTEQQAQTETPPPPGAVMRSFAYNAANRMASVSLEGELIMSYRYNGAGERVYRSGSNETVHTVFDQAGHWIGDYDATGNAIQQAIWFDGMPVGLVRNAGNALDLHYVEADALGTPRVVIDPIRDVVVWRWDLGSEAFGESEPEQDPDGDDTLFVLDLRYPGQQYDSASGFNYNYFRDYDPSVGRYVQSDPIGLAGGISTYGYVGGNPMTGTDPYGLEELRTLVAGKSTRVLSRAQLEAAMSNGPLSRATRRNLDRGCIGLTSAYQGLGETFPEKAAGTKCFLTFDAALKYANSCKGKVTVFAKQGDWSSGPPKTGASQVVPNSAISSAGGHYNYVIYFRITDTYAWMNHSSSTPGQKGMIAPSAPLDYNYPEEIWCTTCQP